MKPSPPLLWVVVTRIPEVWGVAPIVVCTYSGDDPQLSELSARRASQMLGPGYSVESMSPEKYHVLLSQPQNLTQ